MKGLDMEFMYVYAWLMNSQWFQSEPNMMMTLLF